MSFRTVDWEPDEELWLEAEESDNGIREYVNIDRIDASDCRRGFKMDCDEKHELTAQSATSYIEGMAEDIRAGGSSLPPVLLLREGSRFFVLDGHHRVIAARDAGCRRVPALVSGPAS